MSGSSTLLQLIDSMVLNSSSSVGFLGTPDAVNILKSISVGIAILGVYCILSAFLPEVYRTYRSKNTVGINKLMFLLHSLVGTFFFIGGVILIICGTKGYIGEYLTIDLPITGVVFTVCNLFGMTGCWYTLLMKLKHVKASAELGISEADYFKDYLSKGKE